MKKYRPFHFDQMAEHEKWLADMARQGWPTIVVLVCAAVAATMNVLGALRAKACMRQLDPQRR